jgi:hypothetical protein
MLDISPVSLQELEWFISPIAMLAFPGVFSAPR